MASSASCPGPRCSVVDFALSCYDEHELLRRSQRLKRLFETALKAQNMQMGFPLFPTFLARPDAFCEQYGNSGHLGFLCLNGWQLARAFHAAPGPASVA